MMFFLVMVGTESLLPCLRTFYGLSMHNLDFFIEIPKSSNQNYEIPEKLGNI